MTQDRPGPGSGPTVRRMLVGAQLRRLRTDMGLSREEAAEAIRASEWKIHRLENGRVGFKDRDIVDLLRLYGVTDPEEVAGFLEFAREANAPGWWQYYGDLLPQWFRVYVDLESAARSWTNWRRRGSGGSRCGWPARRCSPGRTRPGCGR
jgi:transcriptional regulator with XRE-family HTH domain